MRRGAIVEQEEQSIFIDGLHPHLNLLSRSQWFGIGRASHHDGNLQMVLRCIAHISRAIALQGAQNNERIRLFCVVIWTQYLGRVLYQKERTIFSFAHMTRERSSLSLFQIIALEVIHFDLVFLSFRLNYEKSGFRFVANSNDGEFIKFALL